MVQENSLSKVLVICGATASGKTALAVECAKNFNGEVVSAESMCIYRGLDIGTAKPTEEEKQGIPHYMIDVAGAKDNFSVGDYKERASLILKDILSRGKLPIICGGTGFYINSLLFDLSYGNAPADNFVRAKYVDYYEKNGKQALYDLLVEKDPETAYKLHVNDVKRVSRALEILEISGKKKSEIKDDLTPRYDYRSFAIDFPREVLYDRINKRVDIMMNDGLLDEVRGLLDSGVTRDCQSMQGIGYKEAADGFENGLSESEIAETIKFNTRHYAKRQITFFKRDERLKLLSPKEKNGFLDEIYKELQKQGNYGNIK
ncbi:MAG: tRNA (adenosine(37)-N6)-dimethylallyltransferase MiaA [Candidatus Borkfalkiaceae bacterium]|nr:tRNA (adenosine(37)-N6)-dimethylallyltransferase MiaA [Christensenellaceae bacterium]